MKKTKINNVLFILVVILIAINSYTFIIASKDAITGKAGSAVGTTSICVGIMPDLTTPTPTTYAVIAGTFNTSTVSNYSETVNFYYLYFGIPQTYFATDDDADDDSVYNATIDTTTLPDGNCNYRIIVTAQGKCGTSSSVGSAIFTVNNIDSPPIWSKFNNIISTDFSSYSSWVDIAGAKIGEPGYGMIEFTTKNFDGADLDTMFNISYNLIAMQTAWYIDNCFDDIEYRLTFFNVTEYAEPIPLRNNYPCGSGCYNFNYTGGDYTFTVRVSGKANFSIGEGGDLAINFTSSNASYDNSPTINVTTYMHGSVKDIPIAATCSYMTDYDPTNLSIMEHTGSVDHSQTLPEQNWSYLPTDMGHYPYIQHHTYYSGTHTVTANCTIGYQTTTKTQELKIKYTERDRLYYSDGDEIKLYLKLEEPSLTINANFSQMDSNFNPSNVIINNTGLDYNISYNISNTNTMPDGQYNLTIEAFNSSGAEVMNGSIFSYLHNSWERSDIDDAFDCWNYKQGYYFDEVGCDWESDVNHVADLVDAFTTEISCFDSIDNDLDGKADATDTDCAGTYYAIRRTLGIESAFLGDPCFNNVCRVCLGAADNNNDGICDTSDGVNVRYLNKVQPGAPFKVKFLKSYVANQSVRVSVNYLESAFHISDPVSYVEQLPRKELGGCTAGTDCISVTGTTFGPSLPDRFTGELRERMTMIISSSCPEGAYPGLAAGKSISGSTAFQNLVFFEVRNAAILNESDDASYCFDDEDNDLNDHYDCFDITCNLTYNPANASQRCEMPDEITCDDGYDNDRDGFADCEDNNCFGKNGTDGPCYLIEDFNSTSCADSINNDFDWGYRCDQVTSVSYQTRQTNSSYSGTIRLTDCLDIDCDNNVGSIALNASCEHCNEKTCNDAFDNDADYYYDCTGNAYTNNYERDCDRWHDILITCPTTETNCTDTTDNDLDSDSPNGEYNWLGIPVYGGWDCRDLDCDSLPGNTAGDLCQWGNETICDDLFDNDGDGLTDCSDPTSCKGISGEDVNLTGLCRPCAIVENISIDSCRDGDNNDYEDGIDCADTDCQGMPGPEITICGATENNCTDLIDNDFDGQTDQNDTDCINHTVYPDELGPGQCNDGINNDLTGGTDCADTDCVNTMRCRIGSYTNTCASIGNVGAIAVCRTRFVVAGNNLTVGYTRSTLGVASVVLKLGNIEYSLRNISPTIDDETSFMTGTTTNFYKVNDTYGLKAQNTDGFSGSLALYLISTTSPATTPGNYELFISTSIPGIYGTSTIQVYVAENEIPTVNDIDVKIGNIRTAPGEVNVTFTTNVTDNGTYNSGIAFCTMKLDGYFEINSSSCSQTISLPSGTYNITATPYDGALNKGLPFSKEFTFLEQTIPTQKGDFYNPYPAENYPDKEFFNNTEKINIGVNFEGGDGFLESETGCRVDIRNRTDIISTQYVNLSVVAGDAHCNGQVNLSITTNSTNGSNIPDGVYYFTVSASDITLNEGTTSTQDFNLCYYYYDNSSGKYRCMDACLLRGLMNRPPVLISDIPNQTWPRAIKLSVIDLDDYFMDLDNDPITFTWVIDAPRINVSIDRANLITFDPDPAFYGFAHITFYAHDPYSATPSNLVTLEVTYRDLPPPAIIPSGGGGGGGVVNRTMPMPTCEEDWICGDWGLCMPSGYQTRNCRDKNSCGTSNKMPEAIRSCQYNPTCKDKIKNQGETGIDCGGPCPPCATCNDGILNNREEKILQIMSGKQDEISDCGGPFCPKCPTCDDNTQNGGETGIDCGGPCRSCATCYDKIRNQGEANIDCGGPCEACNVRVEAIALNWNLVLLVVSAIFLLGLLLLALLFGVFKKKFIRLKARLLNYYMRSVKMFEKKKTVEKELPILQWAMSHLDSIEEALPSKSVEQSLNAIDGLVRIFFKRVFLIRYAFTNDELMKELDKHRMPTILKKATEILFEELYQIKYGGETVEKEEIKTLVEQVKVITEKLVTEIEAKKKTKINISEHDLEKISETEGSAGGLSIHEAMKRIKK